MEKRLKKKFWSVKTLHIIINYCIWLFGLNGLVGPGLSGLWGPHGLNGFFVIFNGL